MSRIVIYCQCSCHIHGSPDMMEFMPCCQIMGSKYISDCGDFLEDEYIKHINSFINRNDNSKSSKNRWSSQQKYLKTLKNKGEDK